TRALSRVVGERGVEAGLARHRQRRELVQPDDLLRARESRNRARPAVAECVDLRRVACEQRHARERSSEARGGEQLGRLAEPHRPADVHEDGERETRVLGSDLHDELSEPLVHVPVDPPQLVARRVVAVVGELDSSGPGAALALSDEPVEDRGQRREAKAAELPQQVGVEERLVARKRLRQSASSRTSLTTEETIWSAEMPRRSASKVRISRWRSAGSATARTSS